MKKLILLGFLVICFNSVMAQSTVTFKPGDSFADFKTKYVYRNPTFMPSRVFFKDGTSTRATLNYNHLSDRMEFIGSRGDTLELVDNQLIKEVHIDKSKYRFNEGFFEIIKESPEFSLAMKKPVRMVNQKKMGAMGIASNAQGIETYQSLGDISGILKLTPNIEHIFSVAPIFYFGNKNFEFLPATQKNLIRVLPGKKDAIQAYAKSNTVNYTKVEDILALLTAIKAL
ncbi:MAG: hypothetical protein V4721_06875 [Bacteroidota bacterium]